MKDMSIGRNIKGIVKLEEEDFVKSTVDSTTCMKEVEDTKSMGVCDFLNNTVALSSCATIVINVITINNTALQSYGWWCCVLYCLCCCSLLCFPSFFIVTLVVILSSLLLFLLLLFLCCSLYSNWFFLQNEREKELVVLVFYSYFHLLTNHSAQFLWFV